MEADWDEVSPAMPRAKTGILSSIHLKATLLIEQKVGRILLPPPAPNALHTPVTALSFDSAQELVWAGNEYVCDFPEQPFQKLHSRRLMFFKGPCHIVLWQRTPKVHFLPRPCTSRGPRQADITV